MAAYRRVYDSRHLQADCQEPGSAPGPYARKSSMGYIYLFILTLLRGPLQLHIIVFDRNLTTSSRTEVAAVRRAQLLSTRFWRFSGGVSLYIRAQTEPVV